MYCSKRYKILSFDPFFCYYIFSKGYKKILRRLEKKVEALQLSFPGASKNKLKSLKIFRPTIADKWYFMLSGVRFKRASNSLRVISFQLCIFVHWNTVHSRWSRWEIGLWLAFNYVSSFIEIQYSNARLHPDISCDWLLIMYLRSLKYSGWLIRIVSLRVVIGF